MVERLRADGIGCEPVLQAFGRVERHRFVDTALATQAYEDTSLPIGLGQTISKPSVVARMLALLFESGAIARAASGTLGRVLEIGTGCGYQAAHCCRCWRAACCRSSGCAAARQGAAAPARLAPGRRPAGHGDGRLGHAPWAPYDHIVAAAGGDALPPAWLEQLAVGGRLVAPMQDARAGGQVLVVVDRTADGWREQRVGAVHFVPLKSGRE
jgi:protein-L-isoaspartate(D-aspartate) O-methyltransferase